MQYILARWSHISSPYVTSLLSAESSSDWACNSFGVREFFVTPYYRMWPIGLKSVVVYLALLKITLMYCVHMYCYVQMNVIYSMCMCLNMWKWCTLADYIHDSYWFHYIQQIVHSSQLVHPNSNIYNHNIPLLLSKILINKRNVLK